MKCNQCGKEFEGMENQEVCPECANASDVSETAAEVTEAGDVVEAAEVAAEITEAAGANTKPAGKNGKKLAVVGIAAVAIAAIGAFALSKGLEKDPKETVITAFENIVPEDQVSPTEEIFGWSAMQEFMMANDSESGMSLTLDQTSSGDLAMLQTGGFRVEGKSDKTNKKGSFDMAVTYGGMDFMEMNAYYGDENLMMAVPQLSNKVFTLDLSEGLVDRVRQSELLAPMLAQSGVDMDALESYIQDMKAQVDTQTTQPLFDVKGLYKRYQEGSKAQEDFKAALLVEKVEKKEWTIDGKAEKCRGYNVTISKDAMMKFLRDSSDFFLNDETLREDFLKQMEMSVRASQIFGAGAYGAEIPSASQMQDQTYEQIKESVDQALTYLDQSLGDVQMQVYVDKKGRLAAVDAVTKVTNAANAEQAVLVTLHGELQGGAYLTQNGNASLVIEQEGGSEDQKIEVLFTKQGVSDDKQLTSDFMVEMKSGTDMSSFNMAYTGTYTKDGGDYHMGLDLVADGTPIAKVSVSGVVDALEKGKSMHVIMDEMKVDVMGQEGAVVLSGDLFWGPMTGEVTALEGTAFDVVAATESDWQGVIMEAYFGIMSVAEQLGVSL